MENNISNQEGLEEKIKNEYAQDNEQINTNNCTNNQTNNQTNNESLSISKKQNIFKRVWNYFTLYEKIWMFSLVLIGIVLTIIAPILFPNDYDNTLWIEILSMITLVGGISCELLLSKQSKWAYVVSFFFYDITQTIIYIHDKFWVDVAMEVIFWIPFLIISFFTWSKHEDNKDKEITEVKKLSTKQGFLVALGIAIFSISFGALSYFLGGSYPWLDAVGSAFNLANGLFLIFRYREQWFAWYVVAIIEAVQWILMGQYIMVILSIGYLMNTTYGLIKWNKYIKANKNTNENINKKQF